VYQATTSISMQNLAGSQHYWDLQIWRRTKLFWFLIQVLVAISEYKQTINVFAGTATWATGPGFSNTMFTYSNRCCYYGENRKKLLLKEEKTVIGLEFQNSSGKGV